jgi:hypothetical protein
LALTSAVLSALSVFRVGCGWTLDLGFMLYDYIKTKTYRSLNCTAQALFPCSNLGLYALGQLVFGCSYSYSHSQSQKSEVSLCVACCCSLLGNKSSLVFSCCCCFCRVLLLFLSDNSAMFVRFANLGILQSQLVPSDKLPGRLPTQAIAQGSGTKKSTSAYLLLHNSPEIHSRL